MHNKALAALPLLLAGALVFLSQPAPAQSPAEPEGPQAPPAPEGTPTPQPEAEEEGGEPPPSEEEFKEEVPATADAKARREEIERRACPKADVKYSAATDKTQHPTPEPPADKALVYVLRPTMFGNKVQSKLAVDGQWVGVNRGRNYFFLALEPGELYFCSKAENRSSMALQVEAGRTYFLEQKIKMGLMKARNKLALMADQKGREKLATCHPSVWKEKP